MESQINSNQDFSSARSPNQQIMVDLHGSSEAHSKDLVNRYLSHAQEANITEFRFVTGRGNHENAKGERGTLYREFPDWISEENLKHISELKKQDGYYDITIKKSSNKNKISTFFENLYKKAFIDQISYLKESAKNGNDEAQYILGYCYKFAIGVEQDLTMAVHYYEKSSIQGNAMAKYGLGGLYWQGKGVRQNDQKAIELFKEAAAKDNAFAFHQLGHIYWYGEGVKKDYGEAIRYYRKAADLGIDIAKRKLGHAYLYGKGVEKNEATAFSLYKEVADKGDAHSAYNVACSYLNGQGVKKDLTLAFKYAKQSADNNDPDAQYLLSHFYHDGSGVKVDKKMSLVYLQRSAENQNKHAIFQLALHSTTTTRQQKLTYLIKAAQAGHMIAQAMILSMFSEKMLVEAGLSLADQKNLSERFWRKPDEELLSILDTDYKFLVLDAYYFTEEDFTKKQKQKIMRLLEALVNQGYPEAYLRMGSVYKEGILIKADPQKALRYWLQGAELGSKDCNCNLGYYYAEPDEGKPDYKTAFHYYSKAAEKDCANSHNYLGILYKNGWGVEFNLEKAIFHLNEALRLDSGEEKFKNSRGLSYKPVYMYAAYNLATLYLVEFQKLEKQLNYSDNMDVFQNVLCQVFYWLLKSEAAGFEDATKLLTQLKVKREEKTSPYEASKSVNFWKAETVEPQEKPLSLNEKLSAFTEKMGIKVAWKITKEDKAWCYIPNDKVSELAHYDMQPAALRKTTEGKHILLIEKVSEKELGEVSSKTRLELK